MFTAMMSVAYGYTDDDFAESVQLYKDEITEIAFTPKTEYIFTELKGGYWKESDDDDVYYYYRVPDFAGGDVLTVTSGETKKEFVYDAEGEVFRCGDEVIPEDSVERSSMQFWSHWTPERNNTVRIAYRGFSTEVPVTIKASGIVSINYTPVKPFQCIQNDTANGFWKEDDNGEQYFYYRAGGFHDGDILTITRTDGSEDYVYDSDYERFSCGTDRISDEDVSIDRSGQRTDHWMPDKENYLTISYGKYTCNVPVTIIKSDVTSISYTPVEPLVMVENDSDYGDWSEDDEGNRTFQFSTPSFQNGDVLSLTTGDATKEYVYKRSERGFVCGDDIISFDSVTKSIVGDWKRGTENILEFMYQGLTCQVKVNIIENTIKSIAFKPARDICLIENDEDYGDWDYDDNDVKYFWYYLPSFGSGDILEVTTAEGTQKYVYDDERCEFVCGSKVIDDWKVEKSRADRWAYGKNNEMIITYNGLKCTVPVSIVQKHDHDLLEFEKVDPGCETAGSLAHWECKVCHKIFIKDEDGDLVERSENAIIIEPLGHGRITEVAAVKATDKKTGCIHHWTCSDCGKCFTDAAASAEIDKKNTVITKDNFKASAKKKQYTVKAAKKTTLKAGALYSVKNKKGAVSYKKSSGDKKFTVAKNGNITVSKGLKKGRTYTVKVKVTSAGNEFYRACTRTVTFKIKIK